MGFLCCLCHPSITFARRTILSPQSQRFLSASVSSRSSIRSSVKLLSSSLRHRGKLNCYVVRFQSAVASQTSSNLTDIGFIPEPPPIPETTAIVDSVSDLLSQFPEGSLQALGIGSYWSPAGWAQHALEFVHHTTEIPYWGVIALTTLALRICLFPVVIRLQRSSALMSNYAPQTKEIQDKIVAAKRRGDQMQAHLHTLEYMEFTKKMGFTPGRMIINFAPQIATFLTFFVALRGMANAELPGFLGGGILWFQNLCLPDVTWVLPIVCSTTLLIILELGIDTGVAATNMKAMKWVMRGIPLVTFYFIKSFPAAILVYWTSANVISLFQALLLRHPSIRAKLKIPKRIIHPASRDPKKSSWKSLVDLSTAPNATTEFQKKLQQDEANWKAAASGSFVPTFKINPKAKKVREAVGGATDINSRRQ